MKIIKQKFNFFAEWATTTKRPDLQIFVVFIFKKDFFCVGNYLIFLHGKYRGCADIESFKQYLF